MCVCTCVGATGFPSLPLSLPLSHTHTHTRGMPSPVPSASEFELRGRVSGMRVCVCLRLLFQHPTFFPFGVGWSCSLFSSAMHKTNKIVFAAFRSAGSIGWLAQSTVVWSCPGKFRHTLAFSNLPIGGNCLCFIVHACDHHPPPPPPTCPGKDFTQTVQGFTAAVENP